MFKIHNIDSDLGDSSPIYEDNLISAEKQRNSYIKYVFESFLDDEIQGAYEKKNDRNNPTT
jgi:hypothetical protein